MNSKICNKTILLIAPVYFGYEKEIVKELHNRGAKVLFIEENIDYTHVFYKFVNKFPEPYKTRLRNNYFLKKINEINETVDYVFCIRINFFNECILSALRNKYSNAQFFLYYWDSCKNLLNAEKNSMYFDRVLTFDFEDANRNNEKGWVFRPLFYIDKYVAENVENDYEYDISYTATLSRERAEWCEKLNSYCKAENLLLDVFLYSKPIVYFWNKRHFEEYKKMDQKYVSFVDLPAAELAKKITKAKVVFDCSHSSQSGLTMRTIECVGAAKRMITTNANIKKYDFYNEDNIMVIDDGSTDGISDFCNKSTKACYSEIIRKKYSISGWLDDILNEVSDS